MFLRLNVSVRLRGYCRTGYMTVSSCVRAQRTKNSLYCIKMYEDYAIQKLSEAIRSVQPFSYQPNPVMAIKQSQQGGKDSLVHSHIAQT